MPLIQTATSSVEPVTLADVKTHCRIIDNNEDTLLSMLIGAARRFAEAYTGRSFITQSWRLILDSFPGNDLGVSSPFFGRPYSLPKNAVLFEKGPVLSVQSIVYTAMDGTTQTINSPGAPDYAIDLSGPIPRMTPGFGKIWPISLPQIGSVQINYTAGYGPTPSDVPEGIRHWLLLRIASLYENREEVALMTRGRLQELPYVDSLLDPYKVVML